MQTTDALSGRAALVTGAASGIGRAVTQRLVEAGVEVLAVDVNPDPAGPGVAHEADLTDPQANAHAVAAARAQFGRLDIVVANAGVQHVAPIEQFPLERWETMIAPMLTSPFLLAQSAWPALRASPGGRFVAIASAHALAASPLKSAYVSAKHGVLGLVRTLALEGADDEIAATAVCPGYVRTPLVERQVAAHGLAPERVLQDVLLEPHAVKQLIEPAEVAEVVPFSADRPGAASPGCR